MQKEIEVEEDPEKQEMVFFSYFLCLLINFICYRFKASMNLILLDQNEIHRHKSCPPLLRSPKNLVCPSLGR